MYHTTIYSKSKRKKENKMKFTTLTAKEFTNFAKDHPQLTFHQSISWGKLKKKNSWVTHLVGIKDKKEIKGASLLLEKATPFGKSIFYAPRGFLIDYENKELLAYFTKEIKQYVKEQNGFFIKIDPYISYQDRSLHGNIIENGNNHKQVVENLTALGYHHLGFTKMHETLQPRWMFVLDVKNKTMDEVRKNFDSKTKRILKRNASRMIKIRELTKEELPTFKKIMQATSDRRDFVDRPLSYYENMWNAFHDDGHLKIMIAELPVSNCLKNLNQEQKEIKKEITKREERKKTESVNEEKFQAKQKLSKEKLEKTEKQIEEMTQLEEQHGDNIILGGMLFLLYGKEIVYLMGGSFREFLHFQSAYSIHEYMIQYTIENNYDIYNFYGITGIFDESNPLYGIYFSKKGFGGNVVELIGEFDFIISPFYYYLYKISFSSYHKLKNLLHHIKSK